MSRRRRTPLDTQRESWVDDIWRFERPRSVRWAATVLSAGGDIQLQQLEIRQGWWAEGPGGAVHGELSDVLHGATAAGSDPEWIDAVIAAIQREPIVGRRRSTVLVKRASGVWFHATRSENRESIRRFGLEADGLGSRNRWEQ
jgi:hypothetical protein